MAVKNKLQFSIAGGQLLGQRELQEDAFLIRTLPGESESGLPIQLAIVADGIGGYGGGDVASQIAVNAFAENLTPADNSAEDLFFFDLDSPSDTNGNVGDPGEPTAVSTPDSIAPTLSATHTPVFPESEVPFLLQDSLTFSNRRIADEKALNAKLQDMASTLVAALVMSNKLFWISVGDSHLYVIRNRRLRKLNKVHNYGAMLDEQKRLGNPVPSATASEKRMLTSAIEGQAIDLIDCPEKPFKLRAEDTIVIASDGIDALSLAKIVFYAGREGSAEESVENVLKAVSAAQHPRQDNATVIIIKCANLPETD